MAVGGTRRSCERVSGASPAAAIPAAPRPARPLLSSPHAPVFPRRALLPHRPLPRGRTVPAGGSGKARAGPGAGGRAGGRHVCAWRPGLTAPSSRPPAGPDPRSRREGGKRGRPRLAPSPLLTRPPARRPASAASPASPPLGGGGGRAGGLVGVGGAAGCGGCREAPPSLSLSLVSPQLLPRRTDWTGKEHPRSYESLVSGGRPARWLQQGKFASSPLKIEFPAFFLTTKKISLAPFADWRLGHLGGRGGRQAGRSGEGWWRPPRWALGGSVNNNNAANASAPEPRC